MTSNYAIVSIKLYLNVGNNDGRILSGFIVIENGPVSIGLKDVKAHFQRNFLENQSREKEENKLRHHYLVYLSRAY